MNWHRILLIICFLFSNISIALLLLGFNAIGIVCKTKVKLYCQLYWSCKVVKILKLLMRTVSITDSILLISIINRVESPLDFNVLLRAIGEWLLCYGVTIKGTRFCCSLKPLKIEKNTILRSARARIPMMRGKLEPRARGRWDYTAR